VVAIVAVAAIIKDHVSCVLSFVTFMIINVGYKIVSRDGSVFGNVNLHLVIDFTSV
jgi:hypothetical protein